MLSSRKGLSLEARKPSLGLVTAGLGPVGVLASCNLPRGLVNNASTYAWWM